MSIFYSRLIALLLCFSVTIPAHAVTVQSWSGQHSSQPDPAVRVARTDIEWAAIWTAVGQTPPYPLPAGRMGVAVFLGFRSSGGFSVSVDGFEDRECLRVVQFTEEQPAPNAIVIKMITFPWTVELLPATTKPTVFETTLSGRNSGPVIPSSEGMRLAEFGEACAGGTAR